MTTIDLGSIKDITQRRDSLVWLYERLGEIGNGWYLRDLRYIDIDDDKLGTYFILF